MARSSYAVVSVLLAVIIASAAMPASARINLLQNPGFETADYPPWDFPPWEIDGSGDWDYGLTSPGHTGTYYAWIWTGEGGTAVIWQDIDPPRCAEYLEFYYRGEEGEGGIWFGVDYSDGTEHGEELPARSSWDLRHVDLDTTKLVRQVGGWTELGAWLEVDDFDLEACAAPPVGGEVMTPTPIMSPVMLIAVIAAASAIALGYRFTRK